MSVFFDEELEFVNATAEKVYKGLSEDDKDYIREHPDPVEYHFGLGLYIRNTYIHGNKKLDFPFMADDLSGKIIVRVIELVKQEVA